MLVGSRAKAQSVDADASEKLHLTETWHTHPCRMTAAVMLVESITAVLPDPLFLLLQLKRLPQQDVRHNATPTLPCACDRHGRHGGVCLLFLKRELRGQFKLKSYSGET